MLPPFSAFIITRFILILTFCTSSLILNCCLYPVFIIILMFKKKCDPSVIVSSSINVKA